MRSWVWAFLDEYLNGEEQLLAVLLRGVGQLV
jgi:hypothetical protein